eukprot:m.5084 g.5084  ORF g.5084 m.5084 type:complete len:132 (-) comp4816_c0_seq1:79-474(-)
MRLEEVLLPDVCLPLIVSSTPGLQPNNSTHENGFIHAILLGQCTRIHCTHDTCIIARLDHTVARLLTLPSPCLTFLALTMMASCIVVQVVMRSIAHCRHGHSQVAKAARRLTCVSLQTAGGYEVLAMLNGY